MSCHSVQARMDPWLSPVYTIKPSLTGLQLRVPTGIRRLAIVDPSPRITAGSEGEFLLLSCEDLGGLLSGKQLPVPLL